MGELAAAAERHQIHLAGLARGISHAALSLLVVEPDLQLTSSCSRHYALLPAGMHRGTLPKICKFLHWTQNYL